MTLSDQVGISTDCTRQSENGIGHAEPGAADFEVRHGTDFDALPAPLVTVLIITYNHQRYIEAAVESALSQETDFPVEILISEDASTDDTRRIVTQYAEAHPSRISLLLSNRNVRSNEVVVRGLRRARGRYVSMLDGDDFWVTPDKLQRQADFLDANPSCAAVFFNAVVAIGDRVTDDRWTKSGTQARLDLPAIMEGNPFATCAGMMRAEHIRDVPAWYADFFPITDWPLYALCAARGALAFVDEVSGAYRLHEESEFSSKSAAAKHEAIRGFFERLARVADAPIRDAAVGGCSRYFFDWAKAHLASGDLAQARSCFGWSVRAGGIGRTVSRTEALRFALRLFSRSIGWRR